MCTAPVWVSSWCQPLIARNLHSRPHLELVLTTSNWQRIRANRKWSGEKPTFWAFGHQVLVPPCLDKDEALGWKCLVTKFLQGVLHDRLILTRFQVFSKMLTGNSGIVEHEKHRKWNKESDWKKKKLLHITQITF